MGGTHTGGLCPWLRSGTPMGLGIALPMVCERLAISDARHNGQISNLNPDMIKLDFSCWLIVLVYALMNRDVSILMVVHPFKLLLVAKWESGRIYGL